MVEIVISYPQNQKGKGVTVMKIAMPYQDGVLLEHFGGKTALVRAFEYSSYILAYLIVGYPVLLSTVKNIVRGKIFDENFLMTVASIGAMNQMRSLPSQTTFMAL